jgi:hypothetical protein
MLMIIWITEEGEGQLSEWAEGQYATGGGGGASHTPPSVPPLESASLATVNEIRAAASSNTTTVFVIDGCRLLLIWFYC